MHVSDTYVREFRGRNSVKGEGGDVKAEKKIQFF